MIKDEKNIYWHERESEDSLSMVHGHNFVAKLLRCQWKVIVIHNCNSRFFESHTQSPLFLVIVLHLPIFCQKLLQNVLTDLLWEHPTQQ